MCDLNNCVFTCLTGIIFNVTGTKNSDGLNKCQQCDEQMCGPAFVACAGANRRRCGIVSDLQRDAREICSSVDPNWSGS